MFYTLASGYTINIDRIMFIKSPDPDGNYPWLRMESEGRQGVHMFLILEEYNELMVYLEGAGRLAEPAETERGSY